ncbi:hypothetical protein J3R82DRAFT_6089 [Butyriboletus roseoflavus]|nr:hypothetical protein J3R82DRAFT_6089 [Butyriboletus roseoflavus]
MATASLCQLCCPRSSHQIPGTSVAMTPFPGGWMMVVMDKLSNDFETLHYRLSSLPGSVFGDMLAKLKEFHAAGYVHGDLRDVNIMVSKSDKKRFMIMHFDWAGKRGEARYPDLVDHKGTKRPAGARFRKEILAHHDLFMLEYINRARIIRSTYQDV